MKLPILIGLCLAALAPAAAAVAASPSAIYMDNCAACHQPTGLGVKGAFPALAGDPFVVGASGQVINVVLNGRGGMPAFKDELNDAQLAAAISYIRTGWSNRAKPVSPAEVAAARTSAPKARSLQAH